MNTELEKDIFKLADESYCRGGKDAMEVFIESLETIYNLHPTLSIPDVFQLLKQGALKYDSMITKIKQGE